MKKKIKKDLLEPYPLPLGRKEFDEWSDKIIDAACIPGATKESLKFALADMITHSKPNESFVPLGHFVHTLRKVAANQVALDALREIKEKRNAETKVLADSKV
jgi:hypothetical protein